MLSANLCYNPLLNIREEGGHRKLKIRRFFAGVLGIGTALALAVGAPVPAQAASLHISDPVTFSVDDSLGVQSQYVSLVDLSTGRVVVGKNQDEQMNPASMTKVMTLLVACEHLTDLTAPVAISQDAIDIAASTGLTRVGFVAGEVVTVADLLYGTILPSGADAAIMLGRTVAGSDENFVALMNQKAAELGLTSTHFVNCTGMTAEGHLTTPSEMAVILQAAMENDIARTILTTQHYTTTATTQHPSGIALTNQFLSRMSARTIPGTCLAAKTGYTRAAMCCAASCFVSSTGRTYICVTGHAPTAVQAVEDQAQLYRFYCNAAFENTLYPLLASIGYPGAILDSTASGQ